MVIWLAGAGLDRMNEDCCEIVAEYSLGRLADTAALRLASRRWAVIVDAALGYHLDACRTSRSDDETADVAVAYRVALLAFLRRPDAAREVVGSAARAAMLVAAAQRHAPAAVMIIARSLRGTSLPSGTEPVPHRQVTVDLSCYPHLALLPGAAFSGLTVMASVSTSSLFSRSRATSDLQENDPRERFERRLNGAMILPPSLLELPELAFAKSRIDELVMADCKHVAEIPTAAFSEAEVGSVALPPALIRVGERGFVQCTVRRGLNFPPSLRSLGAKAFMRCRCAEVDLSGCHDVTSLPAEAFRGVAISYRLALPPALRQIGREAFVGAHLPALTLPASVVSVGPEAFRLCTIPSLDLSACVGLTKLASGTFASAHFADRLLLPPAVTEIDDECFSNLSCRELALPASLRTAGSFLFDGALMETLNAAACAAVVGVDVADRAQLFAEWQRDSRIGNVLLPTTTAVVAVAS